MWVLVSKKFKGFEHILDMIIKKNDGTVVCLRGVMFDIILWEIR